jgi:hypothetical protein
MSGIIAQNVLDSSGLVKAQAGGGAWNFIKKLTASGSGDLSFVDGTSDVVLDSTYKEYMFTFNNIHPQTDAKALTFQGSTDTGSSYGVTATTTSFFAGHLEADNDYLLAYDTDGDQAQSTAFIKMNGYDTLGNDNDQSQSGYMHLFNPSSTTFVKHFFHISNFGTNASGSAACYGAGYFNTTSAVDAIQFKMASDNMDSGDICLYGITT